MVPATLYKTSKIQNIDLQDGGQNAAASAVAIAAFKLLVLKGTGGNRS